MASPSVIQFDGMTYLRVFGKYICQCPYHKPPHVWVANELPKACGKCKRITWNRKDERFTKGRKDAKRGKKGRK